MLDDRAKMMAYMKTFVRSKIEYGKPHLLGGRRRLSRKAWWQGSKQCCIDARGLVCLLHTLAGK